MLANQRGFITSLIFILFIIVLFTLNIGTFSLSTGKVLSILSKPFLSQHASFTPMEYHIVWHVRLPRIIMAFFSGGILAMSGATLQGVFHNPLVDPHIIGVTSGAAFGGSLAILLGFPSYLLILSTFSFGLLTLFLIYVTTMFIGKGNRIVLVLAGVILSGFFSALVSLIQYLADAEEVLPSIVFWLLGSFATASWAKLAILLPCVFIAAYLLFRLRWHINVLSLGDMQAKMLGVSIKKTRWFVLLLCALLVATQVAVSGSIGWIGLVIPHLTRFFVGGDHRYLLPASFLIGGIFMIVIDTLARTLTSAEIPVGIITALLGAPIFTLLLLKTYRKKSL
ncbi:FecCD family ABC transporter permease [Pasteurella multocida]|uniref:PM1148 protein n=1 Tax=Pasteurella multocida TaxID=747 RepID=A0A140D776_PASMD|nr:iron ABC transporter permease [Pasteurella multocida]AMK08750.1 PM1148 protein [Pasteurella multocida]MDC4236219.1 iron ABC transporter permease [Pasteurella multocida]OIQ13549.1 ABC transporter permease [Pasteurella multocida subsp. multocida]PNW26298.1 ABC transporter permease [Pasteurella multocida subsp. multocida]